MIPTLPASTTLSSLLASLRALGPETATDGETTASASDVAAQVAQFSDLASVRSDCWTGPEAHLLERAGRSAAPLWTLTDDTTTLETGALFLVLPATSEAPEERHVWEGPRDLLVASVVESAAELCETEERRGSLHVVTGDDSSRQVATIERTGGWRIAS